MKGIILAGGSGTRLHPATKAISKQLIPIYDKPMIYYPLSILMLANIKDILIISTEKDLPRFQELFNNGSQLGLNISYKIQPKPEGIAQAFLLGENFIQNDNVCLILGDNIFYGHDMTKLLKQASSNLNNNLATIFAYYVNDPQNYGVAEFDNNNNIISIEEKPSTPKSNYAITGLYFYPNNVIQYTKTLKPSNRNELEISSLNQIYLNNKQIKIELMGRGFAWLDTGTYNNLLEASTFIQTIEKRQGQKIACLTEIAYNNNFINKQQLISLSNQYNNNYKKYLLNLI